MFLQIFLAIAAATFIASASWLIAGISHDLKVGTTKKEK